MDGTECVGVPIGYPDFVQQCVAAKTSAIIQDVERCRWYLTPSSVSTCSAFEKVLAWHI